MQATGKKQTTYNLEVDADHSYFVGNDLVWVHNTCIFPNQMADKLSTELSTATRLKVSPMKVGSPDFDNIINGGEGVKWAVTSSGELLVIPKYVNGTEIAYSVITAGEGVLAAGEAEIAGSRKLGYIILNLNNHSGHFKPSDASLEVGRRAFVRALGIKYLCIIFVDSLTKTFLLFLHVFTLAEFNEMPRIISKSFKPYWSLNMNFLNHLITSEVAYVSQWVRDTLSGIQKAPQGFNWLGLAQAASSEASESSEPSSLEWAFIALLVYDHLSNDKTLSSRDSFILSAMMLRALMITRFGEKTDDWVLDTKIILNWFFASLEFQPYEVETQIAKWHLYKGNKEDLMEQLVLENLIKLRGIKNRIGVIKLLSNNRCLKADKELEYWLSISQDLP